MTSITIPLNFDEHYFSSFLSDFWKQYDKSDEIHLLLKDNHKMSLSGYVLLCMLEDLCKKNLKQLKIKEETPNGVWALFKSIFSSPVSTTIEDAFKDQYLPLRKCNNSKETFEATDRITKILQSQMGANINSTKILSWCIGELGDNAGVHGYETHHNPAAEFAQPVYLTAFNTDSLIYVVIADFGIGIINSLKKNNKKLCRGMKKEEILKSSIVKGVSGHPDFSPGFGLFGCSELARHTDGRMYIISDEYLLEISRSGDKIKKCKGTKGTFITLKIDKNTDYDLSNIIQSDAIVDYISDLLA